MEKADHGRLCEVARHEAASMRKALTDKPGTDVRMPAAQFLKLATLIEAVATQPETSCSCLGAPIDGIRFWVPLDQVDRERAEAAALRRQNQALLQELNALRLTR